MEQSSETISLEELSLHCHDDATLSFLTEIIVDESSQNTMIRKEQLKPTEKSTNHQYGIFHKVKSTNQSFMMYTPAYHGSCSAIKFDDYVRSSMYYTKNDVDLQGCQHSCHPFLYPFFMANVKVREFIGRWVSNNDTSPLLQSVQQVLDMYKDDEDNSDAYMYSEEDWTDRLADSLKVHPFFANESLACLRSFRFGDTSNLQKFREQHFGVKRIIAARYLFHGLPDLYIINQHPQIIQCSSGDDALVPQERGLDATSTALEQHPTGADTTPTALDASAIGDTPAVVIGEAAKGHLPHNYPFSKMGELLANLHCAHNDHILQRFLVRNDCTIEPFNITGIFLHKESGCSKFAMELKSKFQRADFTCFAYHIDHSITPTQLLDASLLCAVLTKYAGINLHTP